MGTWRPMDTLLAPTRIKIDRMQILYDNMKNILLPESTYVRSNDPDPGNYITTTSTTWADVSTTYMGGEIEVTSVDGEDSSYGRDIMVTANVVSYAAAGTTLGFLDLAVDGVRVGHSTDGSYLIYWNDQPNTTPVLFFIPNLLPGNHTIRLQHRSNTGGAQVLTAVMGWHWWYMQEV